MMKRRILATVLTLGLLLCGITFPAAAEGYAENLQSVTVFDASTTEDMRYLTNGTSRSAFTTEKKGEAFIQLHCDEPIHALYIQWFGPQEPWTLQTLDNDQWVDTGEYGLDGFAQEVVHLDGLTDLRIVRRAEKGKASLSMLELTPYGQGTLPPEVHEWTTIDRCDLMILSAHPDDEYIFLGGMIPTYAAREDVDVQVVYLTYSRPLRMEELLNGLWTAGIRNYPIAENRKDFRASTVRRFYEVWGQEELESYFIRLVRQYQPQVIVTHDINGEYGHGAHKTAAELGMYIYDNVGNPDVRPDCGPAWQPAKLYLHLWEENQQSFDWNIPLDHFGGRTSLEVAKEAFDCHESQVGDSIKDTKGRVFRFVVRNGGLYDNAIFGLYGSTVGEDVIGGDLFENIVLD